MTLRTRSRSVCKTHQRHPSYASALAEVQRLFAEKDNAMVSLHSLNCNCWRCEEVQQIEKERRWGKASWGERRA